MYRNICGMRRDLDLRTLYLTLYVSIALPTVEPPPTLYHLAPHSLSPAFELPKAPSACIRSLRTELGGEALSQVAKAWGVEVTKALPHTPKSIGKFRQISWKSPW
jgi:hypothetical protein